MNSSMARTASGFPAVLIIQSPKSSSLARKVRMASSSSRAIWSGHQLAPAAITISKLCSVTDSGGAIALPGKFQRALFDVLRELLRLNHFIDQPPLLCSLTANPIGICAEHVGMIPPHLALVRNAGQSARSG